MRVTVNGDEREVPEGSSVAALLEQLDWPDPQGVAIAVNLDVVPRAQRPERHLEPGDRVDIVTAVGGG